MNAGQQNVQRLDRDLIRSHLADLIGSDVSSPPARVVSYNETGTLAVSSDLQAAQTFSDRQEPSTCCPSGASPGSTRFSGVLHEGGNEDVSPLRGRCLSFDGCRDGEPGQHRGGDESEECEEVSGGPSSPLEASGGAESSESAVPEAKELPNDGSRDNGCHWSREDQDCVIDFLLSIARRGLLPRRESVVAGISPAAVCDSGRVQRPVESSSYVTPRRPYPFQSRDQGRSWGVRQRVSFVPFQSTYGRSIPRPGSPYRRRN